MMTVREALANYVRKLDEELVAIENSGGNGDKQALMEEYRDRRNAAELLIGAVAQARNIL